MNFTEKLNSLKQYRKRLISITGIACFVAVMGFVCAFNLFKDVEIVYNPNQNGATAETVTLSSQNMNQTVGELLENILLVAEMAELTADPNRPARGAWPLSASGPSAS